MSEFKPPPKPEERIHFGSIEESERKRQKLGNEAIEIAKEAGNVSTIDINEVYDISEASAEAKARQDQLMAHLEQKKAAKSLAVPTGDFDIRSKLREAGHPICLFGEGPLERRERLRLLMAKGEAADTGPVVEKKKEEKQRELFYTEGTSDLRRARLEMLHYSLFRAKNRVTRQKTRFDAGPNSQLAAEKNQILTHIQKYAPHASHIAGGRAVSGCSISPDQQKVATCSWDGLCKLFTLQDAVETNTLRGHQERVNKIMFNPLSGQSISPSAANLASCSADRTVLLWPLGEPGKDIAPIGRLRGHASRVNSLDFHPSGRFVVSTSHDLTWRLWDVEQQTELLLQEGHAKAPYGISIQTDGSLVATTDLGGVIRIWDTRSGKCVHYMTGHVKQAIAVDFHPNGYKLATGSDDHTVKIWDLRRRKSLHTIAAHSGMVSHLRFQRTEESVFLLSASYDQTVKVWATKDWGAVKTFNGHENKVMCVDITRDSKHIVTSSYDKTWKLWGDETQFF